MIKINEALYKEYSTTIILCSILLILYLVYFVSPQAGLIYGMLPLSLIVTIYTFKSSNYSLLLLFILNYFIMGINRYISIPIPITNIFDIIFFLILIFVIIKQIYSKDDFNNIINPYTFLMFGWALYCTIYLFNDTTGEIHFSPWLKTVRPIGYYPLFTCIIVCIGCKSYKIINSYLFILGALSILAAIKGIYQYKYGFDSSEWAWLMSGPARTHLINTGVRYFSFFTDAANFGCSMGFSFIVFFICSIFTKNKTRRFFYWIVCAFCVYGFLLSGTRAAMAVPFVGLALFTIISKNWKFFIFSFVSFCLLLFFLKFTTIGNSNQFVRRMRTVFDTEDASFQVRLDNQKTLKKYMSEAPFGIGIGVMKGDIATNNKFYFASICAPDSDLVNIWIHMGKVGLIIYLIIQFFVYTFGCIYILFKIKSPEIRGPLTGMLCGCAGLLVASYANMINFQFPNGLLTYSCLTLVFLGPYFDKQYSNEHSK